MEPWVAWSSIRYGGWWPCMQQGGWRFMIFEAPSNPTSGLKLRFCTNETQATREKFVKKLQGLGFDISVAEVTAPAPAACRLLKERGLRPHLLVHDDLVPEFADIDKTNPNCVVIGDAAENFSYANLNEAFRVLIGLEKPVLISLGKGRYYKETDGLKLDVGAYMKALEYACDVQAEVVGKPAKAFFESALAEMGVPPEQVMHRLAQIPSHVADFIRLSRNTLRVWDAPCLLSTAHFFPLYSCALFIDLLLYHTGHKDEYEMTNRRQ
uniref:Phospholysine phosphohistidine inorganic pyrophosphate phosphatase n=1 Tax=Meleagris gallopavo TaxID=9103 RepID=G1NGL2_MELGA